MGYVAWLVFAACMSKWCSFHVCREFVDIVIFFPTRMWCQWEWYNGHPWACAWVDNKKIMYQDSIMSFIVRFEGRVNTGSPIMQKK